MSEPNTQQSQDGPILAELLPGLTEAVTDLARAARNVPEPSDIYYYKNIPDYKDLSKACSSQAQALLEAAASQLVRPSASGTGIFLQPQHTSATRAAAADADPDPDSLEELLYDRMTALLDDTYERLDAAIDASKQQSEQLKLGGWAIPSSSRQPLRAAAVAKSNRAGSSVASIAGGSSSSRIQRHIADLPRPQEAFSDPPDNSNTPWTPSRFPHLAAKLAAAAAEAAGGSNGSSGTRLDRQLAAAAAAATGSRSSILAVPSVAAAVHPFAEQLGCLQYQPWQLQKASQGPQEVPADLNATPFTYVDSAEGLAAMVAALEGEQQVAIDLEHHSYRSFQGFTCLMQVSSRSADWVVDTLALRGQLGPALTQMMNNPKVEKVLHGADSDVQWLQRDFGLYIVNMFDTGQAARVLAYPSASLAHLLERHVGVSPDKRYQLADWRLRPLPADMLHYARVDTHYLLYVADRLKDELRAVGERVPPSWSVPLPEHSGAQGALGLVLERSRQICLTTYQKSLFTETAYLDAVLRWGLALPPRNMAVFAALFAWRDRTARALDESVSYVMPKGTLIELSRAMPQSAAEVRKLLGRGSGLSGSSAMVLSRAEEVSQIITQGQLQGSAVAGPGPAAAAVGPVTGSVAAASAGSDASQEHVGIVDAAAVKPRELPAIKAKAVSALTAKPIVAKPTAGGMRGVFSRRAGNHHHQQQSQQLPSQQQQEQQQVAVALRDEQQQHELPAPPPPQQEQQQPEQQQQQLLTQQQQQPPLSGAEPSAHAAAGAPQPKQLAPVATKRSGSSLGSLFSKKQRPNAQQQQQQQSSSLKARSFQVDFLLPQQAEDSHVAVAGAADDGASNGGVGNAPPGGEDVEGQRSPSKVSGAEVRALVDQMMADEDATDDFASAGQNAADAVDAAADADVDAAMQQAEGDNKEPDALADFGYQPLSTQRGGKQRQRREQPDGSGNSGSKRHKADPSVREQAATWQQQQEAGVGKQVQASDDKAKGIFDIAGANGSSSGSEDESDLDDAVGALPAFDPTRLLPKTADGSSKHNLASDEAQPHDGSKPHHKKGGRGGRGGFRGGNRGRSGASPGRMSLAAVRQRQGSSGQGAGGKDMFKVQDGPFKGPRRKATHGGRSKTFR